MICMFNKNKPYSLFKSRQIMKSSYKWYEKKGSTLRPDELSLMESHLENLDRALLQKERLKANDEARTLEEICKSKFKKSSFEYIWEIVVAVVIALAVATVIRSSWFELYEIPSGSMRPTFKEQDHLTVSKTTFGINVPLQTNHFLFEPENVQRTSVFIWSGDGIPHLDSDSMFMKIFPYTKRYIKRCMGKPGDILYFYGGKVFGVDKNGDEIEGLSNSPYLTHIDYVPFLSFEGRRSYKYDSQSRVITDAVFNYFDLSLSRYVFNGHQVNGEIFNGKEWIKDNPTAQKESHTAIETLSDFFGFRNYAVSRLLNKKQVEMLTSFALKDFDPAPSLSGNSSHSKHELPRSRSIYGNSHAYIKGYSTLLPLQTKDLETLMNNMYTCRFSVKEGKASSYGSETGKAPDYSPSFKDVPNGTYEFYYGKAVEVGLGAITHPLPPDHPP